MNPVNATCHRCHGVYVKTHHARKYCLPCSDAVRAEVVAKSKKAYRERHKRSPKPRRQAEQYSAASREFAKVSKGFAEADEFPPPCHCGCGEPVRIRKFNRTFKVMKYASPLCYDRKYLPFPTLVETVPLEEVREKIIALKKRKGWTWKQMGQMVGNEKYVSQLVFAPDRKSVRLDTLERLLVRLSGFAEQPNEKVAERYKARSSQVTNQIRTDNAREKQFHEKKAKVATLRETLAKG